MVAHPRRAPRGVGISSAGSKVSFGATLIKRSRQRAEFGPKAQSFGPSSWGYPELFLRSPAIFGGKAVGVSGSVCVVRIMPLRTISLSKEENRHMRALDASAQLIFTLDQSKCRSSPGENGNTGKRVRDMGKSGPTPSSFEMTIWGCVTLYYGILYRTQSSSGTASRAQTK
jgi:hypothetical protein